MKKFETGKTYYTSSICDHNCIFALTVVKRTAKRLTLTNKRGDTFTKGITPSYDGTEETCYFSGRYSMAPAIGATDTKELFTDWGTK
jgi:hypothetical protein